MKIKIVADIELNPEIEPLDDRELRDFISSILTEERGLLLVHSNELRRTIGKLDVASAEVITYK